MKPLYPYQQTAVTETLAALDTAMSVILQMPTGAGKTRSAVEIIERTDGIVWFVCHRREIEEQAAKAFREAGIDFGIVSPRAKPDMTKRVQIVSVGTLANRLADLPRPALVIWDECHHVAAKSWAAIREGLADVKHVGLTATPERMDGKGLDKWFDRLVIGPAINELIEGGYLSPFRYFAPSQPDLTEAKLQAGDYKKTDLAAIMNTPVLIGDAVREYRAKIDGKRALAFCATVEASKALVARFNDEGIPALHIDGTTPGDARKAAVVDLAAGRIKLLSNVEVFTEGFDVPAIDAVILLRPTKSPTLLLQMIGRAMRRAEGKDCAYIMDHAGLEHDHGLFSDYCGWSLAGGAAKARRAMVARGPRTCPECSEVRAERVEVCGCCGFRFPSGREIGEYDGVLAEARGEIPEGCETQVSSARRWGVTPGTIRTWFTKGMGRDGPFPLIHQNDTFIQKYIDKTIPPGLETIKAFANRMGISTSGVHHWSGRGMPKIDGLVLSKEAEAWARSNQLLEDLLNEKPYKFASRFGVHKSCVGSWVKRGMPGNGKLIPIESASNWVKKNVDIEKARSGRAFRIFGEYTGRSLFAKHLGVSAGAVSSWINKGLPRVGKLIPVALAEEWVRDNIDLTKIQERQSKLSQISDDLLGAKDYSCLSGIPEGRLRGWLRAGWIANQSGRFRKEEADAFVAKNVVNANIPLANLRRLRGKLGYINRRAFEELLGCRRQQAQAWVEKHGLPYAPQQGIPIQAGLEWVRDNRPKIVIPPEAWPSTNDNHPQEQAA